jgi:hypothetical protein
VTFLLMLVHNFSMNSVTSVDHWMNILEKEIEDIVVSKHSAHLAHVERVLKGTRSHVFSVIPWRNYSDVNSRPRADFSSYLDPLEGILLNLSSEQEEQLSLLHEQNVPVRRFSQPTLPGQGTIPCRAVHYSLTSLLTELTS